MGIRRAILGFIALTSIAPNAADAQRLRGMVRDSASSQPVTGAIVILTDSAGKMMARSIGDGTGRFAVMRIVGSSRLRVLHIGYRPLDISISTDFADSVVDVQLTALPPVLAVVKSSARRVCPGEETASAAGGALELWEQARTALLASVVAREAGGPKLQLLSIERTLEPIRRRVIDQHIEAKTVVGDRSYIAARPAWAFARDGYMEEGHNGTRTFFAPDEDVLLDQRFVETHCLRAVPGGGTGHLNDVGIGFEPVDDARRDTLVDISGVLWIDRKLSGLRSLEFKYTGLEPAADRSDGNIKFQLMPNGASMIQQWTIRSTAVALDEPPHPDQPWRRLRIRPERTNSRTLQYFEEGGTVAEAIWPDGSRWHADLPRVVGVVIDMNDSPVPNVRVWLSNTEFSTTTLSDGSFQLPYVLPGLYHVLASDSLLATQNVARTVPQTIALGASRPGVTARVSTPVQPDTEPRIRLRFHPRADVLTNLCPAKSYKPGTGVLIATVMTSDGEPAENARIDVEAVQAVVVGDTLTRRVKRSAEANVDGRFVVCGAPLDQPILIRATKDGETAEFVVRDWKDGVVAVTLDLKPKASGTNP